MKFPFKKSDIEVTLSMTIKFEFSLKIELIQFYCFFSRSIQLSLLTLLIGVGIATVTDVQLNVLGSVLSLLAVVTTCVAQIVSFWDFLEKYTRAT